MHRMRALVAFALLVFGVGGIMSAGAADLGAGVGVGAAATTSSIPP